MTIAHVGPFGVPARRPAFLILSRTHLFTRAAAGLLGAIVALSAFVPSPGMLVEHCVPVDGAAGWLGIQFAFMRTSQACAAGELAIGGDVTHSMRLVVLITLPLLLANLIAAAAVTGAARVLAHAAVTAWHVIVLFFGFRRPQPQLTVAGPTRLVVLGIARPPRSVVPPALVSRGPPTAIPA